MDILGANLVLLVIGIFTLKVFYCLYVIPAYVVYWLGGKVWGFISQDYKKTEEDYEEEKRMEKMKKKKEKVKYRKY